MNTATSGLLVALLVAASVPVAAQAHEHGVNPRQHNQHQRIYQGVRQGDLTRGESRRLQREAREIRREEHAFRSDGRFTPAERREAHRDLDRLSRDVHRERRDGERRFGHSERHPNLDQRLHYGVRHGDLTPHQARRVWNAHHPAPASTRDFDRRIDRIQHHQRERIEQGIRSGALTRHEAWRLMAEQRAVEAEERRYLADGVLTQWERMDLTQDLNAAGRHIYNETHDAPTRRR